MLQYILGLTKSPDEDEEVTNFTQHFSKELLVQAGVNYAALENEDLRCGGVVLSSNLTSATTYNTLKELAADCMVQKCTFRYTSYFFVSSSYFIIFFPYFFKIKVANFFILKTPFC